MTENRESQPAPLFRRHTRRPRLTSLLDSTKAQAIVLTAPAGYGKTTLAQEWLQGREHVAWYRATSASADLAAFSVGLADVIAPIVPGTGDRLRQRLRVADAPERAVRPLAELMAEDLAGWPRDGVIVIDDYHLVTDSIPVEDFVDWVLTLVPVRVLLTTRRRPAWASARRVLYGEIMEIGPDQLAMNNEEAEGVLSDRSGESVQALVRQAEGWPALIGLAALSASFELPEEGVSDALFRYFAEEVLRHEPPDVQAFMLVASLPTAVNSRLAREILGFEQPDEILERLRSEGILHGSSDLAFHPLLREFLQRKIRGDSQETFAKVADRLIVDAEASHRWDDAFDLCLRLARKDRAARVAAAAASDLLSQGRIETLSKWLDLSAPNSLHLPATMLVRAELLIHRGETSEAIALTTDLAAHLPEDDANVAHARNLAGRALHLVSREKEALANYEVAREVSTEARDLKDALWGLFLSANEVKPNQSIQYLDELEAIAADDIDTHLRLAVGRQFAAEQRGNLAGLWPRYKNLLHAVDHATDPLARTSFLANYAALHVSRGHYSLAEDLASQALRLCRDLNLDFAVGPCLAFRAGAEIGLRKFQRVERTMAEFLQTTARREDPYFQFLELVLRVKLFASTGQLERALETRRLAPSGTASRRGRGEYLATMAIAAAAADSCDTAAELAAEATECASSVEVVHSTAIARAMSAISRDEDRARALLDGAVVTSITSEFRDGLVLAYRAWPVLLSIPTDGVVIDALRETVSLANDASLAQKAGLRLADVRAKTSLEILTPREAEVLDLLAVGYSNGEIAKKLFISQSTVKVHVHHILEKLDVKTRLQAVLKARALLDRAD